MNLFLYNKKISMYTLWLEHIHYDNNLHKNSPKNKW
jgi:hypothetical protein